MRARKRAWSSGTVRATQRGVTGISVPPGVSDSLLLSPIGRTSELSPKQTSLVAGVYSSAVRSVRDYIIMALLFLYSRSHISNKARTR